MRLYRLHFVLLCLLLASHTAHADLSGTIEDGDGNPISGATVHLQADPDGPSVTTGPDGTFTLPLASPGSVTLAAAVTYDASASTNYATQAISATNPSSGIVIELESIPTATNASYTPPGVVACSVCHSEIVDEWRTSVHSTAAEDFWVRDLFSGDGSPGGSAGYVFTETHDPGESGTCATCHSPMADAFDPGNVLLSDAYDSGEQFALDGVSCLGCHQIHELGSPNAIHTVGGTEYRFPESGLSSTDRYVWGPLDDVDNRFMRASYAPFFRQSELCASCHQYLSPIGQTTYEEWQASPYAVPGDGFRTCQDCHMPQRTGSDVICDRSGVPQRPAEQRHAHTFIGSTPEMLTANLFLDTTVEQTPGQVTVTASVSNAGAGHDFPTGVSIRNALLVIQAEVDGVPLTQSSGPTVPDWANDDVPGTQPGDYGGLAGTGYAKILEGRINGQGDPVSPVLFVDAETVLWKNTIPAETTDTVTVTFDLPPDALNGATLLIESRLLYRRAFRALAVTKQWETTPQGGDIEIEVATETINDLVTGGISAEIPTLAPWGMLGMIFLLTLSAFVLHRRKNALR